MQGVPRSVEREFRHYLTCGILDGLARARCAACGHDFLVAFSCKGRGLRPSCTTRRMASACAAVRQLPVDLPAMQCATAPDHIRHHF
jgi:hypothetical protein